MPRTPILSEVQPAQDTRQVINDRSLEGAVAGITPALAEMHQAYRQNQLDSFKEGVVREAEAGAAKIKAMETDLGERTAQKINAGGNDLDVLQDQQLAKLGEEIAKAKRGEMSGVLTASAAEAAINSKVREYSNRFPAFAASFRQAGEVGVRGYDSEGVLGALKSEEKLQAQLDLQKAKDMQKEYGLNWNNPAHQAYYDVLKAREKIGAHQVKILENNRTLFEDQYFQKVVNDVEPQIQKLLASHGVFSGGVKDAGALKADLAMLESNLKASAAVRAFRDGFGDTRAKSSMEMIHQMFTGLTQAAEDGSIEKKTETMLKSAKNMMELGIMTNMPTLWAISNYVPGGLDVYQKLIDETHGMSPAERQMYFDMNPGKGAVYSGVENVMSDSKTYQDTMLKFVKDAGNGTLDPDDAAMVGVSRMWMLAQANRAKPPIGTPEREGQDKVTAAAFTAIMHSGNPFDIKATVTPEGRKLVAENPKAYKAKVRNAMAYLHTQFQGLDIPKGSFINLDKSTGAVEIVSPDGTVLGMSEQRPVMGGLGTSQMNIGDTRKINNIVDVKTMEVLKDYVRSADMNLESLPGDAYTGTDLATFLFSKPNQEEAK